MEQQPKSFKELYILGCQMTGDHVMEYVNNYEDLDRLRNFIDEKSEEEKTQFLYAISDQRTCIVIPYGMFEEKRLPPDSVDPDTNQLLIFACPGWDKYVSILIDKMMHDLQNNPMKSEENLTKWKIMRLAKMYKLGWNNYVNQYLEPLRDREAYFRQYIFGKRN